MFGNIVPRRRLQQLILTEKEVILILELDITAVASALKRTTTLQKLYLYDNKIGDDDAKEIAAALMQNCSLQSFSLWGNKIGNDGAKEIATAIMQNTTLQTLDLDKNKIGDDGAKEIAAALLQNTTLHTLGLDYNDIGADGAKEIQAALLQNTTLQTLYLNYNNIGESLLNEIQSMLGMSLEDRRKVKEEADRKRDDTIAQLEGSTIQLQDARMSTESLEDRRRVKEEADRKRDDTIAQLEGSTIQLQDARMSTERAEIQKVVLEERTVPVRVSAEYVDSIIDAEKKLGEGFFGIVFKGMDAVLGKSFAIKTVRQELIATGHTADVQKTRATFQQEIDVSEDFCPTIVPENATKFNSSWTTLFPRPFSICLRE